MRHVGGDDPKLLPEGFDVNGYHLVRKLDVTEDCSLEEGGRVKRVIFLLRESDDRKIHLKIYLDGGNKSVSCRCVIMDVDMMDTPMSDDDAQTLLEYAKLLGLKNIIELRGLVQKAIHF